MCTVILAIDQWDEAPLVVLANRDERLDRPVGPPAWREHQHTRVFAPVDLEAGGTWIAVSETGMLAAITNRFGAPPDPTKRSRGGLVLDALARRDLYGVSRWMATELDPNAYNGFHLVVADGKNGVVAWSDGARLFREPLGRGFHVLSERSYGPEPSPREERIWSGLPSFNRATVPDLETARAFLAFHDDDPARATCVHLEKMGYGTRSWSFIQKRRRPHGFVWHEAVGPPCRDGAVQVL